MYLADRLQTANKSLEEIDYIFCKDRAKGGCVEACDYSTAEKGAGDVQKIEHGTGSL